MTNDKKSLDNRIKQWQDFQYSADEWNVDFISELIDDLIFEHAVLKKAIEALEIGLLSYTPDFAAQQALTNAKRILKALNPKTKESKACVD